MKPTILFTFLLSLGLPVSSQPIATFSLVISEIFPDPTPTIGLPAFEFIEIQNTSKTSINLKGCKLTDGSSTATINTSISVGADSCLILCASSAVSYYQSYGTCIGLSNFPSLNNEKDRLVLLSPEGKTIHALEYDISWYQNPFKQEGGWTLEMIDVRNPCCGKLNWGSSIHYAGGTPGKKNSLAKLNPDVELPMLLRSYAKDSKTIVLVFSESLDSNSTTALSNYAIQPIGAKMVRTNAIAPFFQEVELELDKPLDSNLIYSITAMNVRDCSGNPIGGYHTCLTGISRSFNSGDLLLNEVLFNPPAGGEDYVELYNAGKSIIDLSKLMLCNRKTTGELYNFLPLSSKSWNLFPDCYAVLCVDPDGLKRNKLVKNPSQLIQIEQLLSLPDDEGNLVLCDANLHVYDELHYHHLWHHPLLVNEENVALERIHYRSKTQDKNNWGSASANVGFGTPTYKNSLFINGDSLQGTLNITPELLTPDNDGRDDRVAISVETADNSSMLSISIYDAGGLLIKQLVKLQSLSGKGLYFWDGVDEKHKLVARGHYWVVADVFGRGGKTKRLRKLIAVGR